MATLTPKKYAEGSFEDAQYQAFGYNNATNNREIRRNNRQFNRYLRSDAGQRMRDQFEADAAAAALAEQQKQQRAKATVEQLLTAAAEGKEGFMNSLQNSRNVNTSTVAEVPAEPAKSAEPVLVPKISYWDRVARQYGFKDSNAVRDWQAKHGLVADGKFGNNSIAVWNQLRGVSTTSYWDAVARANGFKNAAAVATWQAQHGLVADGKIGTKTLAALKAQNTSTTTPVVETPVVETAAPADTPPTWRSASVHNVYDENPVTTVNIPEDKKPVSTNQVPFQNRNYYPRTRHVSWQK